jgi:hypothetical protein
VEEATGSKDTVGFTEIAVLKRSVPDSLNPEGRANLDQRAMIERDHAMWAINHSDPGEFGQRGIVMGD